MKILSQKWYGQKLGTCNTTISAQGCFITCLSMIAEKEPPDVNYLLLNGGGYSNGCMLVSQRAADILGLEYKGKVYKEPSGVCVAETNHYASRGVPQHFFIFEEGLIVDPLDKDPNWKRNHYHIVSYRLFNNKEETMSKKPYIKSDLRNTLKKWDKDFDHEVASDHKKMSKILETYRDQVATDKEECRQAKIALEGQVNNLTVDVAKKTGIIKLLSKDLDEMEKAHNQAISDLIEEQQKEILKIKINCSQGTPVGYEEVNKFNLGVWMFKIYAKIK